MRFYRFISISFLLASFLIISCNNGPQTPYFIESKNYRIKNLNLTEVSVLAEAVYQNPNNVGITVENWDILVTANGIEVGKVDVDAPTEIPANGQFSLPIEASFPPSKVLDLESGILSGILSAISNKEVEMIYKGYFTVKVIGISVKVPVDMTEMVPLKRT